VGYGSFDLSRLLETVQPLQHPESGAWGIGVDEGGVHALEALVMARYYMFTQVYFNVTVKALELHFTEWLRESGQRWPSDPAAFLALDDVSAMTDMRSSSNRHARAVVHREHYPLAYETREHLRREEKAEIEARIPLLQERFGAENLLVSNSAKDPHRLGEGPLLVRLFDGSLTPMEEASHFIRHLARIDRYRIYSAPKLRAEVAAAMRA
jgi:hypothetical protein